MPSVSVIIPTYAGAATIETAVASLLQSDYPRFEVIVVDNGATAETRQALDRLPDTVRVIHSEHNLGFACGNNLGLQHAGGEVIALLNDDTEVRSDWLRNLVSALVAHPDAGLVGSLILEPDGQHIQHAGSRFIANYLNAHLQKGDPLSNAPADVIEMDYVMGAAVAIRRKLLEPLGGLAEVYYPGYYEDSELCYRVRSLGLRVLLVPSAIVIHREKQTVLNEAAYLRIYHRNRWRFILRNLPVGKVLSAAVAEIGWIINITRWHDYRHYRPLARAYLSALFRLPRLLLDRRRLKKDNHHLRENRRSDVDISRA